jgi:hypothetical protein
MAYDYKAIGDQIDALRAGGNEAQAYAMYNGISGMGGGMTAAGGNAGNLDSYLRTRWGDDVTKQWVNNNDTKYGNTLFDPKTGQWAGMGQANGQGGQIAGWDPTQYQAGGMGVPQGTYTPTGYGSGAEGFAGHTGIGVQGDGKTPFGQPMDLTGGRAPPVQGAPKVGVPGAPGAPGAPGGAAGGGMGIPGGFNPGAYTPPQRGAGAGSPFDFMNDEGYQFLKKQGMDGIQGSAAANGSLQSGKTLKDLASFNSGLASQEYGKAFDRFTNARDFGENQYRDDRNFGRANFESDRGYGRGAYENDRDYGRGVYRDDRDYGENQRRYDQGFGEDRRRYDQGFGEGQRRDARDFDYRSGIDDRNFTYGVDQDNRDFGYRAGMDDRNYNTGILDRLAGLGLGGAQGSASLAQFLAGLQSGNTMGGAGAGAAGTMGGANSMNAMISQLMQYLQSQQMMTAFGRKP